ncbi:MAG TPA: uroporphyrinogen-III synthase [Pyrinomonadaceae bacterium]|nr:uroporphyrinogen-III synthase [Pyrinomonadaceae bacterium]
MDKPLAGRTIVVTRAASQAGELSEALESYGANVFICPTIEIREPENYDRLDEALDHLYGYDWLIFTSTNGVKFFLQRLANRGLKVADLDDIRVCAIGRRTADKLHDAHVHVDLVPSQSTAEGVFAALNEFTDQLRGLNILLPRAAVGRDVLPKQLEEAGARVDVVTAYQTVVPENFDRGRLSAMLAGSGDCIAFTSPSTVKNLAKLFDTHDLSSVLRGVVIACIGPITSAAAVEYGLRVDIEPTEQSAHALAAAIAAYYSR